MNQYLTGGMIRELREKKGMTQMELAKKIKVSNKTVSKWETGKGLPDISLLESIAETLEISIAELLSGFTMCNQNVAGNLNRSCFKVCPICGNVHWGMGESAISCHGIILPTLQAENADDLHDFSVEKVEDEYFVTIHHPMTKTHYISFIASVSGDHIQLVKLYPEGQASARIKVNVVKTIYFYCNRDGLFHFDIKKEMLKQ